MKTDPYHDRESITELLKQYNNLRNGSNSIFFDEEAFEKIIDWYDDQEETAKSSTILTIRKTWARPWKLLKQLLSIILIQGIC